jgi:hypothetical protein
MRTLQHEFLYIIKIATPGTSDQLAWFWDKQTDVFPVPNKFPSIEKKVTNSNIQFKNEL